jgi:hypothetical protein
VLEGTKIAINLHIKSYINKVPNFSIFVCYFSLFQLLINSCASYLRVGAVAVAKRYSFERKIFGARKNFLCLNEQIEAMEKAHENIQSVKMNERIQEGIYQTFPRDSFLLLNSLWD